jgi:hypothetical protein
MSVLGYENKTANGTVTIPENTVFVVAVCTGTVSAPYLNGNLMQTKGSVAATGLLKTISVHVSTFPLIHVLPFVMNGADTITFIYMDDAVCARPVPVSGYSTSGSQTGTLDTSTNDIVVGIVLGSNGQVLIKGDTVGLTAVYDTLTCRIGYIVPGDSSLSCEATDENAISGYWYTPDPVWVDTTSSVLVEPGHYVQTATLHHAYDAYASYSGGRYYYDYFLYEEPPGAVVEYIHNYNSFATYQGTGNDKGTWYTYTQTWVPDRYETQASGYWTYPNPVWVSTGVAGQISAIWLSIADTMIGSVYVTRPRIC